MRRISLLLLIVMILSACGGSQPNPNPGGPQPSALPIDPTPADGTEGATITFAAWEYERPIYEPLVKKFMADNPGITVILVPMDDLINTPMNPGNAPDSPIATLRRIVQGADTAPAFAVTPEVFGTPLLLDMKPLMDADATFQRDDFYPGAIERWTVKDGTWVLPRSLFVQTLSYNKQLFQAAGLPEPTSNWTWKDVLANAEQIRSSGGDSTYGMFDTSGGMFPGIALLKERGIDLIGAPPQTMQLTDDVYVEVIEQLRDLFKKGAIFNPYGGRDIGGGSGAAFDPQQALRDGQVGIWGDFALIDQNGEQEKLSYPVGRVAYPRDLSSDAIYGGGGVDGYIISGGTAYPEASWKWVEFLSRQITDQQGSPDWKSSGRVPARKALANAIKFWDGMDEQTAATYRDIIEHGTSIPNPNFDYIPLSAFGQALSQTTNDPKFDIRQALLDAQRFFDDARAQVNLTPSPVPDTSPVLVATPESQTIPDGATVIAFSSWGFNTTDLRRLARTFREDHPDIYINFIGTEVFTNTVGIADIAKTSDCFAWNQAPQGDTEFGALLDLRPLLDADATFARDDIPPALLNFYEQSGGLYGLPYAFNTRTLVYNRTLFDKAGITLPPANKPWTPSEFLQAAQALSSGEGDSRVYGYVPLGGPQTDLMFFTDVLGGRLITGSGQDIRPNFADPEVQKGIQWYLDLATVHNVMPTPNFPYKRDDQYNETSYDLIQNGRAAMWLDYGRGGFGGPNIDGPRPIDKPINPGGGSTLDLGVAPLPIGTAGLGLADLNVRGFVISKNAKNPQACWEFIKFMGSDVTQTYGDIPARSSVAQSDAYKAVASPDRLEMLSIYAEVLKQPIRASANINNFYSFDSYWFFQALSNTIKEKKDLATELDAAQKTTSSFVECVAKGGKPPTCALDADPEYQGYNTDQPTLRPIDIAPAG